jgi:hypothetical protein
MKKRTTKDTKGKKGKKDDYARTRKPRQASKERTIDCGFNARNQKPFLSAVIAAEVRVIIVFLVAA